MVKENDVYQQLADMIDEEDVVGIQKTPAVLKVLSLQFTPEEARLALQVHLAGAKLDEIAERSGIKKGKLKKLLNTMADKGTMFIEPGKEDPTYKVVGASAPGLTETGLWGNIKYPFTVELGKALHQVLKEWSEEKLCKLGFPFAPVWAGTLALPDDVQPSENLAEVIRDAGHWSVSPCPCRLSHWLVDPGNHCEHILETCIHTGDLSRWAVEHGMARELSYDEVVELLRECNRDGLVHTLEINSVICNCCDDCCAIFHGHKLGAPTFIPSPFMAQVDEETCNACKTCAERCPVGAIEVDDFSSVNQDICIGCGVCVPTCKTKSMRLVRRPAVE
ncbi:MAG: 4Fe-4S binding protein [Dehalococcoidia bacterium]|nr:4Fe-4S binding protein [Dehalococcoidia bacterium]